MSHFRFRDLRRANCTQETKQPRKGHRPIKRRLAISRSNSIKNNPIWIVWYKYGIIHFEGRPEFRPRKLKKGGSHVATRQARRHRSQRPHPRSHRQRFSSRRSHPTPHSASRQFSVPGHPAATRQSAPKPAVARQTTPPRHHPAKARQTTPTRPIRIKSAKQSQLHPPANLVPSPPTISAPRACWSPVKPPPRSPPPSQSIAIPSLTGNDSPLSSARSAVSSTPHLSLPSPIPIVVRRSKRRYPIGTGKLIL